MRTLVLLLALSPLLGCGSDAYIGKVTVDRDSDGYDETVDCDDARVTVNPDAPELCDGLDNDCDGVVDDDPEDATTFYADLDHDGHGDPAAPIIACDAPVDSSLSADDCDDAQAEVFPGNDERCDGLDNDCDGDTDEDAEDVISVYLDGDGDGYGDDSTEAVACAPGPGEVTQGGDCDDDDARFYPGADESDCADPNDYNCDGSSGFADDDADGVPACQDCDDSDAAVNPSAAEVCDASDTDEDCDGLADNDDPSASGETNVYEDGDGDSYGDPSASLTVCDTPSGYVSDSTDCDDTKATVNPGAAEVCDASNTDEDCDGKADDADSSASGKTTWYRDADSDSYGASSTTSSACDQPSGYVSGSTDCDDSKSSVNPGAAEVCDASDTDEDCDGKADDADSSVSGKTTYYRDADSDSYGSATSSSTVCDLPSGHVTNDDDCDDSSASVSPADAEVCDDGVDNDCDGSDETCAAPGYSGVYDVNSGYDTKIYGGRASDQLAEALVGGDFDGDGFGDMLIGSSETYYSASYRGQVFGYYGPFTAGAYEPTDHDDFGHYASSSTASSYFGVSVWNLGDIDGDGKEDYAVRTDGGSRTHNVYSGGSTSRLAHTSGVTATFSCSSMARGGRFYASGGTNEVLCANQNVSSNTGQVEVFEGYATTATTTFVGEKVSDYAGWDLDGGHDIDGDGLDDVIIASPFDDDGGANAGAVYFNYGGVTGTISLGASDAQVIGDAATDYLGALINLVGDADGDGLDDALISAVENDAGGSNAGAVYLITSPASTTATAAAEAKIVGANATDVLTESAMDMGDVDGDGTLDLVLSAYFHDSSSSAADSGAVWVLYGPVSGSYDLSTDADAKWVSAYATDYLGATMALIPDADGDGDVEIAIGTPYHDYGTTSTSASSRGAVWIWPGL